MRARMSSPNGPASGCVKARRSPSAMRLDVERWPVWPDVASSLTWATPVPVLGGSADRLEGRRAGAGPPADRPRLCAGQDVEVRLCRVGLVERAHEDVEPGRDAAGCGSRDAEAQIARHLGVLPHAGK